MSGGGDKFLIRAKDIALLATILTLIGAILGPIKKAYQWDEAVTKVQDLQSRVDADDRNIAVVQSEFTEISKQLEQINWQLRRLNK